MDRLTLRETLHILNLSPHPEGGHYVETFRDPEGSSGRAHSTAIYFVLRGGEVSRWHKVDASEVYHHYYGIPVEVRTSKDGSRVQSQILGTDLRLGQRPQIVISAHEWQSARGLGDEDEFCILGCTVAPAFEFRGFQMAPSGFEPGAL
jgi:uncharacterized protein